jgi:hypothetical protein
MPPDSYFSIKYLYPYPFQHDNVLVIFNIYPREGYPDIWKFILVHIKAFVILFMEIIDMKLKTYLILK